MHAVRPCHITMPYLCAPSAPFCPSFKLSQGEAAGRMAHAVKLCLCGCCLVLTRRDTRENPFFADVTCEGRCALSTVLGGRVEVMEIPSISAAVDHAAETLVRDDRRYKRRFIASHTKGKDNKPVKQQARSVLFFDADYGLGDQRTTPKKEKKGKPATHDPFLDPEMARLSIQAQKSPAGKAYRTGE